MRPRIELRGPGIESRRPGPGIWSRQSRIDSWQSLVHVCRRWRGLIFGSPRCLNLQLRCAIGTSEKISQDVWPALPLLIEGNVDDETSADNVIAELKHSDRIRQIDLQLDLYTTSQIEEIWTQMQVPFPELASFSLSDRFQPASSSRFILGWICATSAIPPLAFHTISGITEITFVSDSPRPPSPCKYSSFGVHFNRGDGHLPLHVDQPRRTSLSI